MANFDFFDSIGACFPIIDFHIHPFIKDSQNICAYKKHIPMSADDMKRDMKRAGISRYAGSVIDERYYCEAYKNSFEYIKESNDTVLKLSKNDSSLIPGIHIHPFFPEESEKELIRCHKAGVKLVGEIVPYLMGWSGLDNGNFSDLLDIAGKLGMVVSYHSSNNDEQMERMICSHPDTIFVAAHPGEDEVLYAHLDRIKKYDNAFLDLSGIGIYRYGMLETACRKVGSERILFGSDYPVCSPGVTIGGILYERISETDIENILFRNAERLLGL